MKKVTSLLVACMLMFVFTTAVAEGGTLIMATNPEFPPFEYVEGDMVVGLDADIAAEIAKDLGMELKIESMAFNSVVPAIASGQADVGIAAMTITEERLLNVDFSDSYYNAKQACIVKKGGVVVDQETLYAALIGVQEGTTGDLLVSDDEAYAAAKVSAYPKALDAVLDLLGGKLDAVVVDAPVAANLLAALNNEDLMVLEGIEFADEYYGIAVAKGREDLLASINATIARITEDGTLEALIEKYFPSNDGE